MSNQRVWIMTAKAMMPASCRFGTYRRVAVVSLVPGREERPRCIFERASGVSEILRTWERRNVGKTQSSAYHKALAEARAYCEEHGLEIVGEDS